MDLISSTDTAAWDKISKETAIAGIETYPLISNSSCLTKSKASTKTQ